MRPIFHGLLSVIMVTVTAFNAVGGEVPPDASRLDQEIVDRGDAYYHVIMANLSAHRGNPEEAENHLRWAMELQPQNPGVMAEAAGVYLYLNRLLEGERLIRKALKLDPDNQQAMKMLAMVLQHARHSGEQVTSENISILEKLVSFPDASPDEYYELARLKIMSGDLQGAAATARDMATRFPADPNVIRFLTSTLLRLGLRREAVETLLDYIGSNPDLPVSAPETTETFDMLGQLVREAGLWILILERGPALVAAQPKSGIIRALYAEALYLSDMYPEAAAEMETALELDGDLPMVSFRLANIYAGQGRLADALDLLSKLTADYPGHARVRSLLAEVLAQRGQTELAVMEMRTALEGLQTEEGSSDLRDALKRRLAALYLGGGDIEGAREAMERVEERSNPDNLEMLARIAMGSGELQEASRLARKMRDSGDRGRASLLEAEVLAGQGKTARARAKFEESSAVLGAFVWGRAAEIFMGLEDPESGKELLAEWVASEPENARAHFRLGAYLERLGEFEQAERSLLKAISLDPENAEALNYLGYTLADRGERLEEALDLVQRALAVDPWNGAYLDSLGWIYFKLGRYREARDPLLRAAREYPKDAVVQEHLGDLLAKLGDPAGAVAAWNLALDADAPDPDQLRTKIDGQRQLLKAEERP